jgi:hypothetical protein
MSGQALSDEIDQGTYQHDLHPMLAARTNGTRAAMGWRQLVDGHTIRFAQCEGWSRIWCAGWSQQRKSSGAGTNCGVSWLKDGPSWAERQLALLQDTGAPEKPSTN